MTDAKTPKPRADWETVEREYRAGALSVRQIGKLHGVSHTAINKRAADLKWERDLSADVRKAVKAKLAAPPPVSDEVSAATSRDIVETAAERGAAVVREHRTGLQRLKNVSSRLLGAAEHLTDPEATDEMRERARTLLGSKESIGDLVEKVGRTFGRVVTLERQAFNLDDDEGGDGAQGNGSRVRIYIPGNGRD